MRLSVLDYGVIDHGKTAAQALEETGQLAREAERLGYHQFWVAEHHGVRAFAISAPEMMMMRLADQTSTIKIGSGGIMPLHYSGFKLAEKIMTLEACHPGRISIALGDSTGTVAVSRALHSLHSAGDYDQVVGELQAWLRDQPSHPLVQPATAERPPVWLLGSSTKTARVAAARGCNFTFGVFPFMDRDPLTEAKRATAVYYRDFRPQLPEQKPAVMVAAFVVVAETPEGAEALARPLDLWMLGNQDFNEFATFPTPEEAAAYHLSPRQAARVAANRHRMVVGNPQQVKQGLDRLILTTGAQELLVIPLVPGIANRIHSLQLLAQLYPAGR